MAVSRRKQVDPLLRMVDANFNRAKEGLRVCEDTCRYAWDDKVLTRSFKDIRHQLTSAIESLGLLKIIASRDIGADVGRPTTASESKRANLDAIFYANSQRVKESLRVLEEIAKLSDLKASQQIKNLRYSFYAIEQKSLKKR